MLDHLDQPLWYSPGQTTPMRLATRQLWRLRLFTRNTLSTVSSRESLDQISSLLSKGTLKGFSTEDDINQLKIKLEEQCGFNPTRQELVVIEFSYEVRTEETISKTFSVLLECMHRMFGLVGIFETSLLRQILRILKPQ